MMGEPEDAAVQRAHAADITPQPASDESVGGENAQAAAPASSPRDQFARSIVRTKVQPPPVRDSTLERPRLLEWLTDHSSDRLVVVSAEAGYGKTTLLADFARRSSVTCLWVQLDPNDGDWISFMNYLIAAVREAQPEFGPQTSSLLGQLATANVTMQSVLDSFVSELPSLDPRQTLLILDDFHLVDQSADVQTIVARVLELAPGNFNVLIASRTPPSIRAARLTAHGRASRLSTDDLRFSSDETADLFRTAYQLPLEPDLVKEIDARAEGWAASLQLVYSSIRERPPSDARVFVRSLSGASGVLYDYLAEEVLAGLSDQLRHVLTRASILDWIVPAYLLAILSTEPNAPTSEQLDDLLAEADRLGLMGRSAVGAPFHRFHPLLRTFLEHELAASISPELRRQMHLQVAETADGDDWVTAADHYISGDRPSEAMRAIGESAMQALGGGEFEAIARLLARVPGVTPPPAVQALRARALLASDGARPALDLLESLDLSNATDYERAIVALAEAAAFYTVGAKNEWRGATAEVLRLSAALPASVTELATVWTAYVDRPNEAGDNVARSLDELGERQYRSGHYFHAAISFHNATINSLSTGDYADALRMSDKAINAFNSISVSRGEYASTLMALAATLFELGSVDRATALVDWVARTQVAHPDAYADAAYFQAIMGRPTAATASLERASDALSHVQGDPGAPFSVANAKACIAIVSGKPVDAVTSLSSAQDANAWDADLDIRRAITQCIAHLVLDDGLAGDHLVVANDLMEEAGAWRFRSRLALLTRLVADDSRAAEQLLDELGLDRTVVVLELAEALLPVVATSDAIPSAIQQSISEYPERWIPLARRQLPRGHHPAARAAARVLAEFGSVDDLPRVTAYERTYAKNDRARPLARRLIVRTSPRLAVHDLGRVRYELSDRTTLAVNTRRKASALLAYLVTCPNQTATKDQVVEALWPDLDSSSAANSFNQTLYFLRRDIDQWYLPPTSPEYVVNESDLVWLDKELVHIQSADFYERGRLIRTEDHVEQAVTLCQLYVGRFAPEFEYEQWSTGWRDRLHALYLNLVHKTVASLSKQGRLHDAQSLLLAASAIDPESMDLDPSLIWVYDRLGSRSAAVEQYRRFAAASQLEIGEVTTSFEVIRSWDSPSG